MVRDDELAGTLLGVEVLCHFPDDLAELAESVVDVALVPAVYQLRTKNTSRLTLRGCE